MMDIFRIARRETNLDELSRSSFDSRDSPFLKKSIFHSDHRVITLLHVTLIVLI